MEDVSRGAPANFMVSGMKRMSMTCVGSAGAVLVAGRRAARLTRRIGNAPRP